MHEQKKKDLIKWTVLGKRQATHIDSNLNVFLFSRQVWNILIQHFTQTALQKTLLTEMKNQILLKFKLALIMSITKIVHCVFDCRSTKAFMSLETTFAVNKWTEKKLMEFDHDHYSAYFWTTHYLSCVVINFDSIIIIFSFFFKKNPF